MSQIKPILSWKEAVFATKGPTSMKETILLLLKGVFMGAANIIPGVSGGTIALITGIYGELISAIKSFDIRTVRFLAKLEIKNAIHTLHLRFLAVLSFGIGVSILSIAQFMTFILKHYSIQTMALFFGLILASILVMGIKTRNWIGSGGIGFILGTIAAYLFVGLIPVTTPNDWWFIFLIGAIIICTMILPGLSGSFLLLILGKYEYIINAVKNPFVSENFIVLLIFAFGCLAGIVAFSRILSIMLEKYENVTMAVLTGIMCGSMRKIWPWKQTLQSVKIGGKEKIIAEANRLPQQFDSSFFAALGLIIVGFVLVLFLEKTAGNKE